MCLACERERRIQLRDALFRTASEKKVHEEANGNVTAKRTYVGLSGFQAIDSMRNGERTATQTKTFDGRKRA